MNTSTPPPAVPQPPASDSEPSAAREEQQVPVRSPERISAEQLKAAKVVLERARSQSRPTTS